MSDAQKPVEETPAAAPAATTEAPAATETPAAAEAETPAEAETAEAPKETTEEAKPAATEETAEAAKPDEAKDTKESEKKEEAKPTPATDGVLGYKAPGLVKGLRFAKRYFWFSDEAVDVKNLTTYFANEKHSISHPTGAWASQSGKGLLFFTKRAEDKATPTGIINLADVSDITKDGATEFHFKFNGNKHTFQANTAIERDSWIAALEAKSTEAKAEKESIVESEGYKAELEKMTKPPGVTAAAASVPKKSTELKTPKEEKTEAEAAPAADKEASKDKEAAKETPKETQKSRSQSRKRASIFGSFLGKKEEPEEKKEEKTEAKDETKAKEETPAEGAAETPAAESTEAAAETTEAKPEEKKEDKEEKKEEKTEAKPEEKTSTKNKRASIFGNIFQKVGSPTNEKSEKEAAPAVPEKDKDTAVSSTAPQLGDPVDASASKPIEPESVTATDGEAKTTEGGTSPSSKSGLLSFMKKDGKKETKSEAKPEEKTEEAATSEATASAEPAQTTPKEKRRSSMFGSLGTKKEKKSETSDGGESDSKAKSNKLGGLFRKPSKAVKPTEKKEETTPTETEAIPEGTEKAENTEAPNGVESTEEKEKKETIGDVSADSVNVGPSNTATVQAAA